MQTNTTKKSKTAFMVLGILLVGALCAALFIVTKPSSQRVKPPVSKPLVLTVPAEKSTAKLIIEALGTVKAEQETSLRMRVSGQVEELSANFESGSLVRQGDTLLRLDNDDYQNALALKQAALAKAEADYALEMGQQRVARTEVAQLNKTAPNSIKNTALALREPQLAQAKAALDSAKVDVEQATLNLARTQVTAPYNALVTMRNVSLGSQANTSDVVGTLVGTDTYFVEAAIPLDKLQSLGITVFNGTIAEVITSTGATRQGQVRHSIATLDETTRMGRILVAVDDPLSLRTNSFPLLMGDQVLVKLQAGILDNAVTLPRAALRDNDTLWVATPQGNGEYTLDIRQIPILWKDPQNIYLREGLESGELIITSPLGAPIQGMPVRLNSAPASPPSTGAQEQKRPSRTPKAER